MSENELVVVEAEYVELGSLKAAGPVAVVQQATAIATELAKIIDSRRLYSTISQKKFVRVEGWTTLGAMMGVLPREVSVIRQEDGGYEAVVELIRASDGAVIGRASALCGMDERRWGSANEYARRSMAITRATGKAYRLGFSWIMTLAGYEPTPAEEMPQESKQQRPPTPSAQTNGKAERPLSAEKLRMFLRKKASSMPMTQQTANISAGQVGLLAGKLEECFAPDKDSAEKRRSVLKYLWQANHPTKELTSTTELTAAQARVTIDWLLIDEGRQACGDKTYALHSAAPAEAANALRAAMLAAGQGAMNLETEDDAV